MLGLSKLKSREKPVVSQVSGLRLAAQPLTPRRSTHMVAHNCKGFIFHLLCWSSPSLAEQESTHFTQTRRLFVVNPIRGCKFKPRCNARGRKCNLKIQNAFLDVYIDVIIFIMILAELEAYASKRPEFANVFPAASASSNTSATASPSAPQGPAAPCARLVTTKEKTLWEQLSPVRIHPEPVEMPLPVWVERHFVSILLARTFLALFRSGRMVA